MSFVTLDKKARIPRQSAAPAPRTGRSTRTLPTVNLLSPATLDRMAVVGLRRRFVAGGLAVSVLIGGGWLMQTSRLHSAQERLAAEQSMKPALEQQVNALAPVAAYYASVDARKQAAGNAMAAEVLFSKALKDLATRTPAGMDIQSMAVSLTPDQVKGIAPPQSPLAQAGIGADGKELTTPPAKAPGMLGAPAAAAGAAAGASKADAAAAGDSTSGDATASDDGAGGAKAGAAAPTAVVVAPVSCARPDPFNPAPIIGCVTINGIADSRAVVGEFITSLKSSDLYADPFIATTSVAGGDGSDEVQFTGSVGLTGKAVSGRYADLSWLSDPKVLAKAEAMIRSGQTASAKWAAKAKRDAAVAKAKAEAEAAAAAAAEQAAQAKAEAEAAAQIQAAAQAAAAAAALADAAKNDGGSGQ